MQDWGVIRLHGRTQFLRAGTPPFVRVGTLTKIDTTGKTRIGDMINAGGLNAGFDGNTSQSRGSATCADKGSGDRTFGTIGIDWGVGVSYVVTQFKAWGATDAGFKDVFDTSTTIYLQGSPDNSSWTTLATDTFTDSAGLLRTVNTGINTSTAYRYHRLYIENVSDSTSDICCAEVEFYRTV